MRVFEKNSFKENIVFSRKNGIDYLQFKVLLDYGVNHAYAFKPFTYGLNSKVISEGKVKIVLNNYKNLCETTNMNFNNFFAPRQNHTDNIVIIDDNMVNRGSVYMDDKLDNIDGVITNKKGVVLATINADCNLLLFYDSVKNVIANIHSGWRGTVAKIGAKAVEKMVSEFGCNPKDIICCICPSIRKCHFEVEKEVKDIFVREFGYTGKTDKFLTYIGKKNGVDKWLIDTVLINKIILNEVGLQDENIVDCGLCSVCNNEFIFSYRVDEDKTGRNTAIISL